MRAEVCKVVRVPGAPLAKAEVGANHDVADAEALVEDVGDEGIGGQAGKGCVEGKLVEVLDPKPRKAVGAGFGIHQAKGRACGREELPRVRLEGDDAQGCGAAGKVDHR